VAPLATVLPHRERVWDGSWVIAASSWGVARLSAISLPSHDFCAEVRTKPRKSLIVLISKGLPIHKFRGGILSVPEAHKAKQTACGKRRSLRPPEFTATLGLVPFFCKKNTHTISICVRIKNTHIVRLVSPATSRTSIDTDKANSRTLRRATTSQASHTSTFKVGNLAPLVALGQVASVGLRVSSAPLMREEHHFADAVLPD